MKITTFDSYESFVQMVLKREGYYTKEKTEAEQARLERLTAKRDRGVLVPDYLINDLATRLRIRGYRESN